MTYQIRTKPGYSHEIQCTSISFGDIWLIFSQGIDDGKHKTVAAFPITEVESCILISDNKA